MLLLLGLLHLAQGLAGPATAILRTFKDTRGPMQLSLAGYWLIGVPVGAAFGFGLELGVFGLWCGLALGVLASAALLNFRLSRSIVRPGLTVRSGSVEHARDAA